MDAGLILISFLVECVRCTGPERQSVKFDEKNENDKITIFLHFYGWFLKFVVVFFGGKLTKIPEQVLLRRNLQF